jgi:hypothetical protein
MDQLRAFAEETMRWAHGLGSASDQLLALALKTIRSLLDNNEDLDPRLIASALNTAAALAATACDVQARALGVDDLLALLDGDLEQHDS